MTQGSGLELHLATIDRVLPFRDTSAVVLKSDLKTFVIFVGVSESTALLREMRGERTDRPMPHDVVSYVLTGFDITVKKIVISSIVSQVFCATLVLEQDQAGRKVEVRLDVRASDSLILALKTHSPIWVTRRVLDDVTDFTQTLAEIEQQFATEEVDDPEDEEPDEPGDETKGS